MSAHTPGPWEIDIYGDVIANGEDIARGILGTDLAEAKANARLIAAAPKFFAGAEEFMAYESSVKSGDDTMAMVHFALASKLLREAYTAATGAQP